MFAALAMGALVNRPLDDHPARPQIFRVEKLQIRARRNDAADRDQIQFLAMKQLIRQQDAVGAENKIGLEFAVGKLVHVRVRRVPDARGVIPGFAFSRFALGD